VLQESFVRLCRIPTEHSPPQPTSELSLARAFRSTKHTAPRTLGLAYDYNIDCPFTIFVPCMVMLGTMKRLPTVTCIWVDAIHISHDISFLAHLSRVLGVFLGASSLRARRSAWDRIIILLHNDDNNRGRRWHSSSRSNFRCLVSQCISQYTPMLSSRLTSKAVSVWSRRLPSTAVRQATSKSFVS
jgi:hypothetical protein